MFTGTPSIINVMSRLLLFLNILTLYLFSNCQIKELAPHQYVQCISELNSTLQQTRTEKALVFQYQYIPSEIQALKSLPSQDWNSPKLRQVLKNYEGHHYATLQLTTMNGKKLAEILSPKHSVEAQQRYMNYLQFHAQKKFHLIIERDTLSCVLYHAEKNKFSQGMTFTLVFQDPKSRHPKNFQEDIYLSFQEPQSNKRFSLPMSKNQLNKIPSLKI